MSKNNKASSKAKISQAGSEMEEVALDRIVINPDVCLGQPTIRGMRITVAFVLKLLASHLSTQEILEAYPELDADDIRQALNYAAWAVSDQIRNILS